MLNNADVANEAGRNRTALAYLQQVEYGLYLAREQEDEQPVAMPQRPRPTKLVPAECPECQGDMVLTGSSREWGICDECHADINLDANVVIKQGRAYMRQAA